MASTRCSASYVAESNSIRRPRARRQNQPCPTRYGPEGRTYVQPGMSLKGRIGVRTAVCLIIPTMVINMDETKLRTIAQLQECVAATPEVSFTCAAGGGDTQRYEHISRVLRRFGYRQCSKADRGVVLAYLRRTSGYSRTQITRLVARWDENRLAPVPLAKRSSAPAAPFARKYHRLPPQHARPAFLGCRCNNKPSFARLQPDRCRRSSTSNSAAPRDGPRSRMPPRAKQPARSPSNPSHSRHPDLPLLFTGFGPRRLVRPMWFCPVLTDPGPLWSGWKGTVSTDGARLRRTPSS